MDNKLFETYEKNDDVFYMAELNEGVMNEHGLEQYESIYLDLPGQLMTDTEIILRRAFHTKWLTHGKPISNALTVRLLLLCVPYITSEGLSMLNIFKTPKSAARFLSANVQSPKNKNGYLRTFQMQGKKIRKGYTLTASARQELLSQFPKEYLETKLSTSTKACTGNNMHDAICCNLYYYLLANTSFQYFTWHNSPYFDTAKSFAENIGAIKRMPVAGTNGFRPDAFITTLTKNEQYYYVEQDMNTETSTRLAEKFANYVKMFDTQTIDEIGNTTIIVSIYTDAGYDSFGKNSADIASERGQTMARLRRDCNNLLVYINTITGGNSAKTCVSEIKEKLHAYNVSVNSNHATMLKKHFRDIFLLLERFTNECPGEESVAVLENYLDNLIAEQDELLQSNEKEHAKILSVSRKNLFRSLVENIPELQAYLRNGLRLLLIDSRKPEELNNVLLSHHKQDVLENKLLPCVSRILGLKGKYAIMNSIDFGAGIHFCNHCIYKNAPEKYLVFENISTDIGAWYRVQNFISRAEAMPKGEMYVFILASAMEDIKKFNKEIYEKETVAERYASSRDARKPKTNISFIYFCYGTDPDFDKPFVLNHDGDAVYLHDK